MVILLKIIQTGCYGMKIFSSQALFFKVFTCEKFFIFIIRAIFSVVFSLIITKFFYTDATFAYCTGLCIFFLAMAYVFDFLRKKKTDSQL